MTPTVLAYGGGLDSFALLIDALARGERPDAVVFCDVADGTTEREGVDPGEWPGTYKHVREVVIPLCAREGIEFVWIDTASYPIRGDRSLFAYMERKLQFPGGPAHLCSIQAKVERFEDWLASRYADRPVEVWIGYEAGEESRAEKDPHGAAKKHRPGRAQRSNRFPLMERGLCRCRCEALVRAAGYPVPRKSACVFCPFGTRGDFRALAGELPETFARLAKLEADKPPTQKNGLKLSYKGWDSKRKAGPMLPVYVAQPDNAGRPVKPIVCGVCGSKRATKAVGCGYVTEEEMPALTTTGGAP
jgi:hypothetical protein